MLRALPCLATGGLLYFLLFSQSAAAPTPPEAHSLREYKSGVSQADPKFDAWMKRLREVRSPLSINDPSEFEKALREFDLSTAWVLRLRRSEGEGAKTGLQKLVAEALKPSSKLANEPLYPYLLQSLSENRQVDAKDRATAQALLVEKGEQSCPRKRFLLAELRKLEKASLNAAETRKYLEQFRGFSSVSYIEDSLRALLYVSSLESQKQLRNELATAIQPYPRLVSANPSLFADLESESANQGTVPLLGEAEKILSSGDCSGAQKKLLQGVSGDKSRALMLNLEAVAEKIEACFRARGDSARITYWQDLEKPLRETYGFMGEALAKRRQALIHWGRDQFDDAKRIFGDLILVAEKEFPTIHADSLFTLARILENEKRFDDAADQYKRFIELYPNHEQTNQSLTSLMVLSTLKKQPDDALKFALQLVDLEALKAVDDRDGGTLAMALYWTGKIYLEKGEAKKAEYFWSRLAQEFYSTFYGALGHYSLERLTHKKFLLPPILTPSFDKEEMYKDFAVAERKTLLRTERLLLAGLKDDAGCEIKEIQPAPNDSHKQLARALFQYASGDWLSAVRIYQNLPKSYRLTLPRGMERILFPISYASLVDRYAEKLKVDPHYINAIIRQESVFNPKAQSPVGARGLMQLMPGTARLESKILRPDYLDPENMLRLKRLASDESLLNDPEINIPLGVHHVQSLFQKYRSPIFVLTSYNANPRATERWLQTIDSNEMLVFIERIPFRETRAYVKLVMRNYFYYKRWYEGAEAPMPLFETLLPQALTEQIQEQFKTTQNP